MTITEPKRPVPEEAPEPELQQGVGQSPAKDDALKRALKQHPHRDEPRIDSIEPDELPPA